MKSDGQVSFGKENLDSLQKIIAMALSDLKSNEISKTGEVKKSRFHQEFKEAVERSSKQGYIDLSGKEKFLYSTLEQVEHYVQLPQMPDFSGLEAILEVVQKKIGSRNLDLIDYGSGNGVKSAYLAAALFDPAYKRKGKLRLVDYNDMILMVAQRVVKKLLCTEPVMEDVIDLEHHAVPRDNFNFLLHAFLGQTIGNFQDPNLVVANLAKSMRIGEYLILEWLKRKPEDYEQGITGERMYRFLQLYFKAFDIPSEVLKKGKENHFMEGETINGRDWNLGYLLVSERYQHSSGIILEPNTKLVGFRSRRFSEEDIISLFTEIGLEAETLRIEKQQSWEWKKQLRWGWKKQLPWEWKKQLRWEECGDRRYALFRKAREIDNLNSKIIPAAILLAFGIFLGKALYNNPRLTDIYCNSFIEDKLNGKYTCISKNCEEVYSLPEPVHGLREPEINLPRCKSWTSRKFIIKKTEIKQTAIEGNFRIYETLEARYLEKLK